MVTVTVSRKREQLENEDIVEMKITVHHKMDAVLMSNSTHKHNYLYFLQLSVTQKVFSYIMSLVRNVDFLCTEEVYGLLFTLDTTKVSKHDRIVQCLH